MRTLAIYYIDPVEGRQKFVIPNPSDLEVEHYLWVVERIKAVPAGFKIGLYGARLEQPTRSLRRDWLLIRAGIKTIRIEEIKTSTITPLFGEAA
jgi:hypothetical protein